jgi:hypothetical protein
VTTIESWIRSVVGVIHARKFGDFAGLGLVFYTDRSSLPVHPLVSPDCQPTLPITSLHECGEVLAQISRRNSICHDGFHLVRADTLVITDVSQFLSPPIPSKPLTVARPGGARHMAARLTSLLSSVPLTIVCTSTREATLYENGEGRPFRMGPRVD